MAYVVMTEERMAHLRNLQKREIDDLRVNNEVHADNWKKRGGVGAFMVMARKWDRIEAAVRTHNYDVFEVMFKDADGVLKDIDDLRAYLLLCRQEVERRWTEVSRKEASSNAATKA